MYIQLDIVTVEQYTGRDAICSRLYKQALHSGCISIGPMAIFDQVSMTNYACCYRIIRGDIPVKICVGNLHDMAGTVYTCWNNKSKKLLKITKSKITEIQHYT